MINNPFTSETFKKIWSKHFKNSEPGITFNFINNVSFVKQGKLPLYINFGNNLTSGITYKINEGFGLDYQGRVFLIRDIPSYYNVESFVKKGDLKLKKILQYEGFITEVQNYSDLDEYMRSVFKSNSRYKFKRNIERLETCFNINYIMYHGKIEKQEFDYLFKEFYKLLDKRYTNKQERCGELDPDLWSYYCDLAFNMINEKTASLFVIYNDKKPIGITFSYHFGNTFIEALTVFDIDYYKFNIGHTTIYKLLKWSFKNNVKIFDYTHGDFEYKRRWSNKTYEKHHHLLYDSSSFRSRAIAIYIEKKFNLKRKLREKYFIKKYHNYRYWLTNLKNKKSLVYKPYDVLTIEHKFSDMEKLEKISIYDNEYISQRKVIFDYIYNYPQPFESIKFFKHKFINELYFGFGELNTIQISKRIALNTLNK